MSLLSARARYFSSLFSFSSPSPSSYASSSSHASGCNSRQGGRRVCVHLSEVASEVFTAAARFLYAGCALLDSSSSSSSSIASVCAPI
mmetsp:Transcript_509/g.968  ORF Transcript_509/g.968 Transcript_509/m.968 type:complete len:88 (-) Transcript_509:96-359(-)